MQENGFSFEGFVAGNDIRWTPTYKGKGIGCVAVAEESMLSAGVNFALWLGLDWCFDESKQIDSELKEFTWKHVVLCPQEKYCKPPYCKNNKNQWKFFEKEYESTCHAPLAFFNPDSKSIENITKLMLMTQ